RRRTGHSNQSAPSALPNQRAEFGLFEVMRETIAARTAPAINEHRLRAEMPNRRPRPIAAVAHAPEISQRPAQQFHEAIRNLPAAVEAFINDQSGFRELAAELAHQFVLSVLSSVRHIDVTNL